MARQAKPNKNRLERFLEAGRSRAQPLRPSSPHLAYTAALSPTNLEGPPPEGEIGKERGDGKAQARGGRAEGGNWAFDSSIPAVPGGLAGTLALVQALGDAQVAAPLWVLTCGAMAPGAGE